LCMESVDWANYADTARAFLTTMEEGWGLGNVLVRKDTSLEEHPDFAACWSNLKYAGQDFIGDLKRKERKKYFGLKVQLEGKQKGRWMNVKLKDKRGANPELRHFSEINFKVPKKALRKHARALLKTAYSDVRISKDRFRRVKIQLKHEKGFLTVYTIPVAKGKLKRKARRMKVVDALAAYESEMKERHDEYQKFRNYGFSKRFWEFSKPVMEQDERCMSMAQWFDHFGREKEEMKKRYQKVRADLDGNMDNAREQVNNYLADLEQRIENGTSMLTEPYKPTKQDTIYWENQAARQRLLEPLRISGFGIWNCDQVRRMKSPVAVTPRFIDEMGEEVQAHTVTIIDKRINGIFMYGGFRFDFSRKGTTGIFVQAMDGRQFFMDQDAVNDLARRKPTIGQQTDCPLRDVTAEVKDVDGIRSLLALK
ncbi:MAG: hypothetical protein AAF570_03010, partial [Bacteroidota bacterium]